MTGRTWAALLAALSLAGSGGCGAGLGGTGPGGGSACTLIGCVNGVTFHLPSGLVTGTDPLDLELCVDGVCTDLQLPPEPPASTGSDELGGDVPPLAPLVTVPIGAGAGRSVEVSVGVRREGQVVPVAHPRRVPVETTEPNGPGCGTCRDANVEVTIP
jgi:hypothetical protein